MITAQHFTDLVKPNLSRVNQVILENLGSKVPLIENIAHYILDAGGKRLRPSLVILGALLFQYSGAYHIDFAAAVELIHTATLLHDDVVDTSTLRRGKPTANEIFGNASSVLVGDFLYSRAFQIMVKTEHTAILKILADASNTIAEGEVMQLTHKHNPDLAEDTYLETIQRKTATLFEAAAQIGPCLAGCTSKEKEAMALFGRYVGMVFQLVDDALDYGSTQVDIGKNLGDDLAEGKLTLPLIHALKHTTLENHEKIRQTIIKGDINNLPFIIEVIASTQAIDYTYQLAKTYVQMAIKTLNIFSESQAKNSLIEFANFALERHF